MKKGKLVKVIPLSHLIWTEVPKDYQLKKYIYLSVLNYSVI